MSWSPPGLSTLPFFPFNYCLVNFDHSADCFFLHCYFSHLVFSSGVPFHYISHFFPGLLTAGALDRGGGVVLVNSSWWNLSFRSHCAAIWGWKHIFGLRKASQMVYRGVTGCSLLNLFTSEKIFCFLNVWENLKLLFSLSLAGSDFLG